MPKARRITRRSQSGAPPRLRWCRRSLPIHPQGALRDISSRVRFATLRFGLQRLRRNEHFSDGIDPVLGLTPPGYVVPLPFGGSQTGRSSGPVPAFRPLLLLVQGSLGGWLGKGGVIVVC